MPHRRSIRPPWAPSFRFARFGAPLALVAWLALVPGLAGCLDEAGDKNFKFDNPLFELENQLISLRALTGNAPLRGYLFFNRSAVFPKGHPDTVLTQDDIPDSFLTANCGAPGAEIRAAWEALKTHQNEAAAGARVSVKT